MFAKSNNGRILLKVGVVLVLLAVAAYFALQRFQGSARVKLVGRGDVADAVTGTVTVDAEGGTKPLTSDAGGRVKWCEAIAQSAHFRKGDRLVELDATELKRAMDQAEKQYRVGKDRLHFTLTGGKPELLADSKEGSEAKPRSDEEREKIVQENYPPRIAVAEKLRDARRLLERGNVSAQDIKTLERALEDIDRELKQKLLDEKRADEDYVFARDSADINLKKMTILAPADGQIDLPATWEGALINPGTVVATWFSNQRVVAAKISEESFGRVKIGQKARMRLLTYGRQEFVATVSKLHPKADEAQRFTVFLDVKIDDPEQLKPNSTGEVTITLDEHPNAINIPRRALFGGNKVWVVKNGRVERREVKLGFDSALNVVEIVGGLDVGEQIIVDRLDEYRDGQRVQVEVIK